MTSTEMRVLRQKLQWHGSCIDNKSEGLVTKMPNTNRIAANTPVQKVVVVNGNTEVLGMLESVLDAGRYDMVFVEPGDRAYSQIRKVIPDLVILCTRIEELDGFQLLTMLIKEISVGGALVETRFPLHLNSLHDFRLTLGTRSIVVKGRVVHSQISDVDQNVVVYWTGIEFVEPSEHVATAIAEFMESVR